MEEKDRFIYLGGIFPVKLSRLIKVIKAFNHQNACYTLN